MAMTKKSHKLSTCPCIFVILLLHIFNSQVIVAMPQQIPPGMMYREDYSLYIPRETLVDRLKQIVERKEEKIEKEINELAEDQMAIQALIDAKARDQREHQQPPDFSLEDSEVLPAPAAIIHNGPLHSGKRTSFMALCHFKICNMGRKRQI